MFSFDLPTERGLHESQLAHLRAELERSAASTAAMAHAHRLHTADKPTLHALLPPSSPPPSSMPPFSPIPMPNMAPSPTPSVTPPPPSGSAEIGGGIGGGIGNAAAAELQRLRLENAEASSQHAIASAELERLRHENAEMRSRIASAAGSGIGSSHAYAQHGAAHEDPYVAREVAISGFVTREMIEANLRALETADDARMAAEKLRVAEQASPSSSSSSPGLPIQILPWPLHSSLGLPVLIFFCVPAHPSLADARRRHRRPRSGAAGPRGLAGVDGLRVPRGWPWATSDCSRLPMGAV